MSPKKRCACVACTCARPEVERRCGTRRRDVGRGQPRASASVWCRSPRRRHAASSQSPARSRRHPRRGVDAQRKAITRTPYVQCRVDRDMAVVCPSVERDADFPPKVAVAQSARLNAARRRSSLWIATSPGRSPPIGVAYRLPFPGTFDLHHAGQPRGCRHGQGERKSRTGLPPSPLGGPQLAAPGR